MLEIRIAAKYSTLPPRPSDRSRSRSESTTGTRELAIVSAYDLGKRLQFAGNLSVEGLRRRRSRELSELTRARARVSEQKIAVSIRR